ncbi:hypothetical protein Tco_0219828, partial [Tanacetum coccineum]
MIVLISPVRPKKLKIDIVILNSKILGCYSEGDVILKMTSEKELKLTNVLYVPEIRKNLV